MPIHDAAANEAAITRLCDALRTNRAIGVVGAGISNWAGYDTWDAVLQRLAEAVTGVTGVPQKAADIRRLHTNKLHQAQRLGDSLGDAAFQDFIRREFGLPRTPVHQVIKTFARLPLSHFLTLNFDLSCELAHDAIGAPYRTLSTADERALLGFLTDCHLRDAQKTILHLHGLFTDPIDSIALHYKRYESLYKHTHLKKFMWSIWMARPLLFAGFSFTDDYYCAELQTCASDVRQDFGMNAPNRHFAILPIPFDHKDDERVVRQTMVDSYLIDAVFYETRIGVTSHERHAGFVDLIDNIANRLRIATATDVVTTTMPLTIPPSADDEARREALVAQLRQRAEREREQ